MCDYAGMPYNFDIQDAVRNNNLQNLPEPLDPPQTPRGLLLHPPTATAAAWEATEKGLSQHSTNAKIQEAIDRQQALEEAAIAQGAATILVRLLAEKKQYETLPCEEIAGNSPGHILQ